MALVALVALAAGCGSSGSSGSVATPVATTSVDLPPSYRFAPSAIQVKVGAAVTWTNHDNFTHSVTFLDGGLPGDPMVMDPGATATFTFATTGTYNYQCHLHPQNMKGTVTVVP